MTMNRREAIAAAGAFGVLAGVRAASAQTPPVAAARPANFVLVHGAWHGGWCYGRVATRLREAGHRVWTPSLSGMAEHAHAYSPAINLSTHIDDIVGLIDIEDIADAVLCGHSYAGMIIAGVADRRPDRVRSLVYLDAFLPNDGQSTFDLDKPQAVATHVDRAGSKGGHTIPPIDPAIFGVNEADRAYVAAKCTPQPLATLCERIRLSGAEKHVAKKMYIYAEGWPAFTPFGPAYDKAKADPSFVTHSVPCGHDVMIDMPDELATLLTQAI